MQCHFFEVYVSICDDYMCVHLQGASNTTVSSKNCYREMAAPYSVAPSVFFRPAHSSDLATIISMEAAGYPPDEAASPENLDFRLNKAPGLFLVAMRSASQAQDGSDELVGYICGTLTSATHLTHDSMANHEPEGDLLCIHSVCVAEGARRKGIASSLLRAYVPYVQQTTPQLRGIRLICKEDLVPLYRGAGFEVQGPSAVVHGKDPWIDMALDFE